MCNIMKSIFLKMKKLCQINVKQSTVFSLNDSFKNTQHKWEMDWENDI